MAIAWAISAIPLSAQSASQASVPAAFVAQNTASTPAAASPAAQETTPAANAPPAPTTGESSSVPPSQRGEVFALFEGFFTRPTSGTTVGNQTNNVGGGSIGYRFHFTSRQGFETRYGYAKNVEQYFNGGNETAVPVRIHELSIDYVYSLSKFMFLYPYVSGGGGFLLFKPASGTNLTSQGRAAFTYGGGVELPVTESVSLRAEYRGLLYHIPDFGKSSLRVGRWTHTATPAVGLAFRF
jgi:opacity protein-like surface antigen